MINISFSPNIILGLILIVGVTLLYLLRVVKPEVARDEDIFFATIGLVYSGILVIHGWRLDPILQFACFLLAIGIAVEIVPSFIDDYQGWRKRTVKSNAAINVNSQPNDA